MVGQVWRLFLTRGHRELRPWCALHVVTRSVSTSGRSTSSRLQIGLMLGLCLLNGIRLPCQLVVHCALGVFHQKVSLGLARMRQSSCIQVMTMAVKWASYYV